MIKKIHTNENLSYSDLYDIEFATKFLKESTGLVIASELGRGSNGIAYLLENGNVFKFTSSENEYNGGVAIMQNPISEHVLIFNAYEFIDNYQTFFGIEKELADGLGEDLYCELPTHAIGDGMGFGSHHSYQRRQFVPSFSLSS